MIKAANSSSMANPSVRSEMSESEKKINDSNYHVREMCYAES
jgi:hypothetical protein